MKTHVLSQHVGDPEPRRINDREGQQLIVIDPDGETVVKSNEKPKQMGLFKGDTENDRPTMGKGL
jgi:hypothetical protein